MQSTLNNSLVSCLEWWLFYGPGRLEDELPFEPCLELLQRLTALLAAHMPLANAATELCSILAVMEGVLE